MLTTLGGIAHAEGGKPLRVCLPEDSAPYSWVERNQGAGLDHDLMAAVAARLGRGFEPLWFESRFDKEGNLALEARALLAAGVCDLVAGFPLYAPHLAPPMAEKARPPDYPGAKPLRQRPWQALVPVTAGAAYRATALVLVPANASDTKLHSLASLQGRSVAVKAGSMASVALGSFRNGTLASSIKGYTSREDVMSALQEQQADFALIDVALWDRYRQAHPSSPFKPAAFDYEIKLNIGLLARASDEPLLREAESAVMDELASGRAAKYADLNSATWIPPVTPLVRPVMTLRDFVDAGG
jgi:ABC-type amino acid transport substrate-binding protein